MSAQVTHVKLHGHSAPLGSPPDTPQAGAQPSARGHDPTLGKRDNGAHVLPEVLSKLHGLDKVALVGIMRDLHQQVIGKGARASPNVLDGSDPADRKEGHEGH